MGSKLSSSQEGNVGEGPPPETVVSRASRTVFCPRPASTRVLLCVYLCEVCISDANRLNLNHNVTHPFVYLQYLHRNIGGSSELAIHIITAHGKPYDTTVHEMSYPLIP